MTIEFIDLAAQRARLEPAIGNRIAAVLDHGKFIMGPEVAELEERLAAYCEVRNAVACANGTDALLLVLMALGLRGGDAVFCPAFTFAATAEVVPCMGATPVFVDVDPVTYNMDPDSLSRAIEHAKSLGLRPAMVIPVDLFGLPADYRRIGAIAEAEGLTILADAAQSFGASYDNRRTGSLGLATTTSFFPAKPLGCYGDGGAIFTDDDALAETLRSLTVHGKGRDKYDNVRIGTNSRLDTLQAAILLEKLAIFPEEVEARNRVAERYSAALEADFITPQVPQGSSSVWAQYTVQVRDGQDRAAVLAGLRDRGIPTGVYYPIPLHQQTAYRDFPIDPNGLPVSEAAARSVFSLPMHPYLDADTQDYIISGLRAVSRA